MATAAPTTMLRLQPRITRIHGFAEQEYMIRVIRVIRGFERGCCASWRRGSNHDAAPSATDHTDFTDSRKPRITRVSRIANNNMIRVLPARHHLPLRTG